MDLIAELIHLRDKRGPFMLDEYDSALVGKVVDMLSPTHTDGIVIHMPRGKQMPMTTEQFHYMGDLYENKLVEQKDINSSLRSKVHELEQKLAHCR